MTDGRPLGSARARALVALVVSFGMLLAPAAAVQAQSAPYANASTTGAVGCPTGTTDCPKWDTASLRGLDEWDFDESRTSSRGPSSAKAAAKLSYVEKDEADGMLGALTISGTISAEVTGTERADSRATFSADFLTRARTLNLVGSVAVESHGTDSLGSGANAHVQLDCGQIDVTVTASGGFEIPDSSDQRSIGQDVEVLREGPDIGECALNVSLAVGGGTDRGSDGTQHTIAIATVSLTILAGPAPSPSPAGCALSGVVTDGDIIKDGHNNPMPRIPVQLFRDNASVDEPATTDASGRFCIPAGAAEPGGYQLRATLADLPLLETRHATDVGATWMELPIVETDFGRQNVEVSFTKTDARPWLPDVANIHWQATRYVEWLTDTLELAPGLMGPATIVALAGIEWHELTHHLMDALGAGAPDNCPLENRDGSWDNASTCASLDEGMALFLPALAAADLNPGASESVSFGIHDNLEDNTYYPWSTVQLWSTVGPRESFAVAQLLWDLTDDTPLERAPLYYTALPIATSSGSDTIAYPIDRLFHMIAAEPHPTNVGELFRFIRAELLPTGTLTPGVDIDGDGTTDVDPLQELLVLHGFHSVHDPRFPSFFIGTTPGRTDHVPVPSTPADLFLRDRPLALQGESIRFTNPGSTVVAYTVDITYPSTTSHFDVPVAAGGERVFEYEPPPYWRGVLADGAALPACGAADQAKVTIALGGGSVPARTL
ncbi:MAG: carboxypeptidase regulatory-like domain-containing protein, partial [Chloroflexi bacterium]|nr:carboxypeptidase regulatory-like domain-containing protein [Chloroflexota bacterium]